MTTEIAVKWTIDDIKGLDDTLTDQQCSDILDTLLRKHDASVGINWDVIQYHIDGVKEGN